MILPFGVALVLVIIGPLLDGIVWRDAYTSYYARNAVSDVAPDDLANAAAWAVDLAQIVPGAFLTITGMLLLSARVSAPIAVIGAALTLTPFVVIALIHRSKVPLHRSRNDRPWVWGNITAAQAILILLNLAGIIIAAVS